MAPRRFIDITLTEENVTYWAKVMAILPSPKIKPGPGRVVLMTGTHLDQAVMEIEFAGLRKALEPTINHPLFSADQNDWVPAGELRIGERIKTKTGTSEIKAIRWKKGEHRVYNFEVEADHSYFVSENELLTHNTGACSVDLTLKYKSGWTNSQKAAARQKADDLTNATTVVTHNYQRSGTSASARYKKAGGKAGKNQDVDHTVDLQLGGADTPRNMKALNKSVNRSLGSQIHHQIKDLPEGTIIDKVTIK